MLLFTFSLRRIYIPHLYHYILLGLVLHVILIAFEPFIHFCKFKVKIIRKKRGERKTVVQYCNAMRATYKLQYKSAML